MSLTSALASRRLPVREWFEERLPNLKGVQKVWRERCTPTLVAADGVMLSRVGMAIDYRLRYFFEIADPSTTTAARGGSKPLFALLAEDLRGLVGRANPVGQCFGQPVVANPTFAGSALVGGADADMIVDHCLIEFKATKMLRPSREWIYQLIAYASLDLDDQYGITEVGWFLPRVPTLVTWDLDPLLDEMANQTLDRRELRAELEDVASRS